MRQIKEIHFTEHEVLALANELAALEERLVHDSARRLFIKAARTKIKRLKSKRKIDPVAKNYCDCGYNKERTLNLGKERKPTRGLIGE